GFTRAHRGDEPRDAGMALGLADRRQLGVRDDDGSAAVPIRRTAAPLREPAPGVHVRGRLDRDAGALRTGNAVVRPTAARSRPDVQPERGAASYDTVERDRDAPGRPGAAALGTGTPS